MIMDKSTLYADLLHALPYSEPFLFVGELLDVSEEGVRGTYTFSKDLEFYRGHFTDLPVTPGVILIETMAQIGVVCLGISLLSDSGVCDGLQIAMTSSAVDFLLPVYPGEKVTVQSKKKYYRFGKLKCEVEMKNAAGAVVCRGVIAGMIKKNK